MRCIYTACLVAVVGLFPGRAHAESKAPYRSLFTTAPIDVIHYPERRADLLDADMTLDAVNDLPEQPQTAKPGEPQHTGVRALVFTTAADFNAFPRRKSTWVILGIGAGAAALALPIDDSVNDHLAGSSTAEKIFAPGKYIGSFYVQMGTAVGLYVVGRFMMAPEIEGGRTNKVSHLGFDLVRALIVSQTLTQGMKFAIRRDRPTGECCAFPSGHASAAFATASVLERHLGYRNAWPTFIIGGYVAASRLTDNRHFLSDVLFGSALGIASGWTVVGRHGRSNFAMLPVPTKGGMMIAAAWHPQPAAAVPR